MITKLVNATLGIVISILTLSACSLASEHNTEQGETLPPVEKPQNWPLNYATLNEKILKPHCAKCHSEGSFSEASSILFFPYSQIANDPRFRWEAPGNRAKIVRSVSRGDKFNMPPPGSPPLSPDEVDYIVRYIDAGKPEL